MKDLFRSVIKALLFSVITAAVLIFIFAFIASISSDSTKSLGLYGRAIFFVTAFAGALYASLSAEEKKLQASLIFGGIFIFVSFFLYTLMGGEDQVKMWIPYICVVAICFISTLIGGNKKGKKPKSLKKYKKATKHNT